MKLGTALGKALGGPWVHREQHHGEQWVCGARPQGGDSPVRGWGAGQLRGEAGGEEGRSFFTRSELSELKGQRSWEKGQGR